MPRTRASVPPQTSSAIVTLLVASLSTGINEVALPSSLALTLDEAAAAITPEKPRIAKEYFLLPIELSTEDAASEVQQKLYAMLDSGSASPSEVRRLGALAGAIIQGSFASAGKSQLVEELAVQESRLEKATLLGNAQAIAEAERAIAEIRGNHRLQGLIERSELGIGHVCSVAIVTDVTLEDLARTGEREIAALNAEAMTSSNSSDDVKELKRRWIDPIQRIVDAAKQNDLKACQAERDALLAWILGVKSLDDFRRDWKHESAVK